MILFASVEWNLRKKKLIKVRIFKQIQIKNDDKIVGTFFLTCACVVWWLGLWPEHMWYNSA
jgi:hypothetical protein